MTADKLEVTADGKGLPALSAPRLETLKGAVRFKILDGQVTIDNVEIRNAAD